jgi:hypothetical protein
MTSEQAGRVTQRIYKEGGVYPAGHSDAGRLTELRQGGFYQAAATAEASAAPAAKNLPTTTAAAA